MMNIYQTVILAHKYCRYSWRNSTIGLGRLLIYTFITKSHLEKEVLSRDDDEFTSCVGRKAGWGVLAIRSGLKTRENT